MSADRAVRAERAVRDDTVDGLVRASALRVPDRLAVRYRDRSWTYAELDAAVTTGAAVLRERYGLAAGDRVATFAHNCDAYLLAFLACARAGLTHVPVNQTPPARTSRTSWTTPGAPWSSPIRTWRGGSPTGIPYGRCAMLPARSSRN